MAPVEYPAKRWYSVIPSRRSRRKYEKKPLKAKQVKALSQACHEFQPFDSARVVFINHSPEKFLKGVIGSYGKIKGAPAFFAFIGDTRDPLVQEKLGFTGEGIVLEAEALQLNTCWIGGFFKETEVRSLIDIDKKERVIAVSPVGVAPQRFSFEERLITGFGFTHKRKNLSDLTIGVGEETWPDWVKAALNAARMAPSAYNRQPWRFHVMPDGITVATNGGETALNPVMSKRLDCGIAMLHIEVAALAKGVQGNWEFDNPPLVAKYVV